MKRINTTLTLGHVGRYSPTGAVDSDEPTTETGRRNQSIVEAWRESGKAQEPLSLPECGAEAGGNAGVLAWGVYEDGSLREVLTAMTKNCAWQMLWVKHTAAGNFEHPTVDEYQRDREERWGWDICRVRIVPVESEGQGC